MRGCWGPGEKAPQPGCRGGMREDGREATERCPPARRLEALEICLLQVRSWARACGYRVQRPVVVLTTTDSSGTCLNGRFRAGGQLGAPSGAWHGGGGSSRALWVIFVAEPVVVKRRDTEHLNDGCHGCGLVSGWVLEGRALEKGASARQHGPACAV